MNKQQATEVIQGFVKQIGLGFHIDTPMSGYTTDECKPLFNERQAIDHQWSLSRACGTLEALDVDPWEVALDAMKPMIAKLTDEQLDEFANGDADPRADEAWIEIERRRLDSSINESIYGASGRDDESLDMFESEF